MALLINNSNAQIATPRSPVGSPNGILFQALAKDLSGNPAKNR
jgi:hypothetical protein